jgi:hypothetical protein
MGIVLWGEGSKGTNPRLERGVPPPKGGGVSEHSDMQYSPDVLVIRREQFRKENGEHEFLYRMSAKCEVGDPFD